MAKRNQRTPEDAAHDVSSSTSPASGFSDLEQGFFSDFEGGSGAILASGAGAPPPGSGAASGADADEDSDAAPPSPGAVHSTTEALLADGDADVPEAPVHHDPPPVPLSFTQETFPDTVFKVHTGEGEPREAGRVTLGAGHDEAPPPFAVTSVEEALEALAADDGSILTEDPDGDDDDEEDEDEPEEGEIVLSPEPAATVAEDDELMLEAAALPPPLPDDELYDDADLPPLSPAVASLLSVEAHSRRSESAGGPPVPWDEAPDEVAAEPPISAAEPAPPAPPRGDLSPSLLASALLAAPHAWAFASPLGRWASPPPLAERDREPWRHAARTLRDEAATLTDPIDRAAWLIESARGSERSGDVVGALATLDEALSVRDEAVEAHRARVALLMERGDDADEALLALAIAEPSPPRQAAWMIELALLRRIDAPHEASSVLREVLASFPEHPVARPLAAELARVEGSTDVPGWSALSRGDAALALPAFEAAVAADAGDATATAVAWRLLADPKHAAARAGFAKERAASAEGRAAARWLQLAAEAAGAAGQMVDHLALLAEATQRDPEDRVLEWRLEVGLARAGQWATLAEVLGREGRTRSPEEQAVRAARRAAILLHHLREPAAALSAVEAALAATPDYPWAQETRLALLETQGQGRPLAEAMLARAQATSEAAARAAWTFQAGALLEHEVGEPGAAAQCYLDAFRAHALPVYQMSAVRLAEARGAWDEVATLLAEAGPAADLGGLSGASAAALLTEHVLGGASAEVWLGALAGPRPDVLTVLAVHRHLTAAGRFAELADALRLASSGLPAALRDWASWEEGMVRLHQLHDPAGAASAFERAAEFPEPLLPACWALRRLGRAVLEPQSASSTEPRRLRDVWPQVEISGEWPSLLAAPAAETGPGSLSYMARGYAFVASADVARLVEHLGALSSSWANWQRGRLLLASDEEAGVRALATAAVQDPDLTVPSELLWRPGAGHQAVAGQALEVGRLWLALARFGLASGDPDAEAWLERALDVPADHRAAQELRAGLLASRGALSAAARSCLDLASAPGAEGGAWAWLSARLAASSLDFVSAIDTLSKLTEGELGALAQRDRQILLRTDPSVWCATLRQELDAESDRDRRRAIGMELGAWLEAQGRWTEATRAYEDLLAKDGGFNPARVGLARTLTRLEEWSRAADILRDHANRTTSELLRAALVERWEEIRADRLEDASALESRLRKHLATAEPGSDTFTRLRELLTHQGRVEELVTLLREEADRMPAGPARRGLRVAQAGLLENDLKDLDGAYAVWLDLLDEAEDADSLAAARRLAERRGDWNGVVLVLARQALSAPAEFRPALYAEIAQLWEDRLDEPETAAASWEKVLSIAPGDVRALEALVRLDRRLERWDGFAAVAAAFLDKVPEQVGLRRELGEVLALRLGRPDDAIPHLEAAAAAGAFSREGFRAVAEALEARGAWAEVVPLWRQIAWQAQEVMDEAVAVDAWRHMERTAHHELRDPGLTLEAREALARLRPDDPEVQHKLAMGYDDAGFSARTLETLDRLISFEAYLASLPAGEQLDIHRKRARYLDDAGRREEALPEYEAIHRLAPDDPEAEGHLISLLEQRGDWGRSAELLQGLLDRRGPSLNDAEKVRLLSELGRCLRRAGKLEEAAERYEEAARLAPNEVAVYQGLIHIRRDQAEWSKLLGLYNQVIRCSTDPAQVVQAYVDKADILDKHLGATDRGYIDKAAMHFQKALQFDRRNTYCMLRLAEIGLESRGFEKAGGWLQSLFASGPSIAFQARAHVLNGILAAEFQKDVAAARDHLRRAATVAAIPQAVVGQLSAEVQRSPGNLDTLMGLYRQVAQAQAQAVSHEG